MEGMFPFLRHPAMQHINVMSSEYTPTRGRRSSSSRRGDRRSGRPNSGGSTRTRQEPKPQKKTLWQKIAAFFGVKPAEKTTAASTGYGTATPAPTRTSDRGDRSSGRSKQDRSDRPERAERPARAERAERPTGFRKPELVEVTSSRIYVGNLSFDASESDLFELFSGVGTVQNVEIVTNKYTQKSKGFAFVQLQSVDEAKRAVSELHDKEYMTRKLVVSGAKAVEEKRSTERARQPEQAPVSEQPAATAQTAQQQPEQ